MRRRGIPVVVLALVLHTAPLGAQQDPPPEYTDALQRLSAADTTGALEKLRAATKGARSFGPAWLRLGALLSARAGEQEKEFLERREAERALDTAFRLMGSDPEVLLEQGLLKRRQRAQSASRRLLERAWTAAEEKGASFAPEQRARLHVSLASIYEGWWDDWNGLIEITPSARGLLHCKEIGGSVAPTMGGDAHILYAALATYCPAEWLETVRRSTPMSDHREEERQRMLAHLRAALDADPGSVEAGSRLLVHLADDGDWTGYLQLAERLLGATQDSSRAWAFVGLGLHRLGRGSEADSAFARAIAGLAPAERAAFEDVRGLVPAATAADLAKLEGTARADAARMVLTSRDPVYLDGTADRRLEHYARIAMADLKFGEPGTRRRGWDTDRGQIWIRYGRPESMVQCCYGARVRTVFWTYGEKGPVFTFEKPLTYRAGRFMELSQKVARDLTAIAPDSYTPPGVSRTVGMPHQVARFRGERPGATRVEVYAAPPRDSLGLPADARVEAGIFLFDTQFRPVWERKAVEPLPQGIPGLFYTFEAMTGRYVVAVEARAAAIDSARPVATVRKPVDVGTFAAGRLSVSDLLLVEDVEASVEPPRRRDDLSIAPRYDADLRPGEPLHLYFEVYGLQPDADGIGRYRAELTVSDVGKRAIGARILRSGRELFGGAAEGPTTASWQRELPVTGDAAVDFLRIELPTAEAGEYTVTLKLTDPATGWTATSTRAFRRLGGG